MADNLQFTSGAVADSKAATDEVSYSGDTAHVQLLKVVHVAGSEGSRTVSDIGAAAGGAAGAVLAIQGIASGVAVAVNNQPTTSGGLSVYHAIAAATANAASVKASAGQLYAVHVFNNSAAPIYVKFHNTAGTPTAGSGVVASFGVQAGTPLDLTFPSGIPFATGIGITVVTGIADSNTTATAASDATINVFYK